MARLVARYAGLTFGRWRQQLHLVVALRELASGASVQQVSADLGYESVTAFITMFRNALGKPPATYLSSLAQSADLRSSLRESLEVMMDAAFFDRFHAYAPWREVPKMRPEFFTNFFGLARTPPAASLPHA